MEIKGIRYTAPFLDQSGYGKAARGNILALHEAGVPLNLNPISFENNRPNLGKDNETIMGLINNGVEYNINLIHSTPEHWQNYTVNGVINIGYTIWETSKLHPAWSKYINQTVDKVLVGCEWNKEVFENSGVVKPIGVVPHGISGDSFNNVTPYNIEGVDNKFMFYSIFQWQERKNPKDLIKAYWHAFTGNEDVVLVLKTYRFGYSDDEKKVVRDEIINLKKLTPMSHYPKIILISDMLTEDEMLGLHARGDCYVSLDRGEGFGLCSFTAGACVNPIIVTGWGGATEYAKEDNSYLVDYTLTPVSGMPQSPWYRGDQVWAQPDVMDAVDHMKFVYFNREVAKDKGNRLRKFINENFSWEVIGQKIIKEMEDI
jgi:glycosyltransferase involved in cell wall biosynthesis